MLLLEGKKVLVSAAPAPKPLSFSTHHNRRLRQFTFVWRYLLSCGGSGQKTKSRPTHKVSESSSG